MQQANRDLSSFLLTDEKQISDVLQNLRITSLSDITLQLAV